MDPRIQRLIELEARKKGVPPALVLQVMRQESAGDPQAVGDGGRSLGLFQLYNKAAIDAGIDPAQRGDVVLNIEGGVEYLRQQLQRAQGDPALALEMYNKGPSLQGRGTPGYAQQVLARGEAPMQVVDNRAAMEERLQALRARKAGTSQAAPAPVSSPGPLDASAVPVSPEEAASLAQRSQFTVDIAKPSDAALPVIESLHPRGAALVEAYKTGLAGPAGPEPPLPADELTRRIDEGVAAMQAESEPGRQMLPGMATEMGGSLAGAIGGARLGARAGPFGAALGGVGGAILGGSVANRAGKAAGIIAPEDPWVETPVANVYTSDILGTAGTLAPYAWRAGKGAFKYGTRAGRALNKADQATAKQAQEALETYQRDLDAWQTTEAQTQAQFRQDVTAAETQAARDTSVERLNWADEVAGQRRDWDTAREAEQVRVARLNETNMRRWSQRESQRMLEHAEKVAVAQQEYDEALRLTDEAFRTKNTDAYRAADAEATRRKAAFRDELQQFHAARAAHFAGVKRLQDLPQRYEPPLPPPVARTLADVQRDMAALDRGGTGADEVLTRLGTEDIFAASVKLNEEDHLLRQGAGEAIASPYQQAPRQTSPAAEEDPLLDFVRRGDVQGRQGLRLSEDDLKEGWGEVIRNRETGTSGLLNNRGGRSVQDAANDAFDQGLLDAPSPDELRTKIADALAGRSTMGRRGVTPEAPDFPPETPAAARPGPRAGQTQRASDVWYQRLDDMAGTAPVDLSPAHEAAATVHAQLLDMLPSLQDPLARKVVQELTEASTEGSVAQVHAALKALGRSIRGSTNPEHRYLLGQMASGFQSALEDSAKLYPETSKGLELMQQAKRAWRQEHAVDELQSLFRTSGPIVTQTKTGELKMDVGKLLNRVENLIAGESPSKGSFTSRGALPREQLLDLRNQIQSFIGTRELPTQRPPLPGNVPVKTFERPTSPPPVIPEPPPVPPPVAQLPRPVSPPRLRPEPPEVLPAPVAVPAQTPRPTLETSPDVEPVLPRFGLKAAVGLMGGAAFLGGPAAALGIAAADVAEYLLSWGLIQPGLRPFVLKAIRPNGTIDPAMLGLLAGAARTMGMLPDDTPPPAAPRQGGPP